jgi:hypothetical protein
LHFPGWAGEKPEGMRRSLFAAVCVLAFVACKKEQAPTSAASAAPSGSAKEVTIPPDMANPFVDPNAPADEMAALGGEGPHAPVQKLSLKSPGAEPRSPMVYDFALAKPQNVAVTIKMKQEGEGVPPGADAPPLRLSLTVTAKEKLADGKTKFLEKVTKAEIVPPKGAALPKEQAAQLELVSKALSQLDLVFSVSKQGVVSDFSLGGDQMSQQVAGQLLPAIQEANEFLFVATPEEPVGAGAQWLTETTGPEGPKGGAINMTFTLKDRSPAGATVAVDVARKAPPQQVPDPRAPKGVTMELEGKGSYTVNLRFASVSAKAAGESETKVTTKDPASQRSAVQSVKSSTSLEAVK